MVPRVLAAIPPERMVLGSDYPIPIVDMPPLLTRGLSAAEHARIRKIRNPIEKNYRQLLAMGFPADIGSRASGLIPARSLA